MYLHLVITFFNEFTYLFKRVCVRSLTVYLKIYIYFKAKMNIFFLLY